MENPTFEEVAELVREQAGIGPNEVILPQTRFERDLGITGDDGIELLQAAEKRFGVTLTRETFNLKPNEFLFEPEASIVNFITPFRLRKSEFRSFTVGELHRAVFEELSKNS